MLGYFLVLQIVLVRRVIIILSNLPNLILKHAVELLQDVVILLLLLEGMLLHFTCRVWTLCVEREFGWSHCIVSCRLRFLLRILGSRSRLLLCALKSFYWFWFRVGSLSICEQLPVELFALNLSLSWREILQNSIKLFRLGSKLNTHLESWFQVQVRYEGRTK